MHISFEVKLHWDCWFQIFNVAEIGFLAKNDYCHKLVQGAGLSIVFQVVKPNRLQSKLIVPHSEQTMHLIQCRAIYAV